MMTEIDKDLYCAVGYFFDGKCIGMDEEEESKQGCLHLNCIVCHRKWPTPDHFEDEYGEVYPDNAAVWYRITNIDDEDIWGLSEYSFIKNEAKRVNKLNSGIYHTIFVVCACTPWGCPPNDWRPGE